MNIRPARILSVSLSMIDLQDSVGLYLGIKREFWIQASNSFNVANS